MDSRTQGNIDKKEKNFLDLLVFYLEHGHLPRWSNLAGRVSFEKELDEWVRLLSSPSDIGQLKSILQQDQAAKRFLFIVPTKHLWLLFEKLLGSPAVHDIGEAILQMESAIAHYATNFSSYINTPAPFHQLFRSIMNEALLKWIIRGKEKAFPLGIIAARTIRHAGYSIEMAMKIFSESQLKESNAFSMAYHHIFNEPVQNDMQLLFASHAPESTSPVEFVKQQQFQASNEGIYISNAGLVLVTRHLNNFFDKTGLRQDKQFVYPSLAVAALQWMATGSEQSAEFELVLPKILCGMELQQPLPQVKDIPAFIKQDAYELLETLTKRWNILKNTSVEGLRTSFLQRKGKLTRVNDRWFLQVEEIFYDMLMPFLTYPVKLFSGLFEPINESFPS